MDQKGLKEDFVGEKHLACIRGGIPPTIFLKGLKKFEIYKNWWMYSLDIDLSIDGN